VTPRSGERDRVPMKLKAVVAVGCGVGAIVPALVVFALPPSGVAGEIGTVPSLLFQNISMTVWPTMFVLMAMQSPRYLPPDPALVAGVLGNVFVYGLASAFLWAGWHRSRVWLGVLVVALVLVWLRIWT
jgi:hypothetical protein